MPPIHPALADAETVWLGDFPGNLAPADDAAPLLAGCPGAYLGCATASDGDGTWTITADFVPSEDARTLDNSVGIAVYEETGSGPGTAAFGTGLSVPYGAPDGAYAVGVDAFGPIGHEPTHLLFAVASQGFGLVPPMLHVTYINVTAVGPIEPAGIELVGGLAWMDRYGLVGEWIERPGRWTAFAHGWAFVSSAPVAEPPPWHDGTERVVQATIALPRSCEGTDVNGPFGGCGGV